MAYRTLDKDRIAATAALLERRIGERFPDSSLRKVAKEVVELAGDIGWRPFQSPRLTLFAEGARGWDTGDDTFWSVGVDAQLGPGLNIPGRYLDEHTVSLPSAPQEATAA